MKLRSRIVKIRISARKGRDTRRVHEYYLAALEMKCSDRNLLIIHIHDDLARRGRDHAWYKSISRYRRKAPPFQLISCSPRGLAGCNRVEAINRILGNLFLRPFLVAVFAPGDLNFPKFRSSLICEGHL